MLHFYCLTFNPFHTKHQSKTRSNRFIWRAKNRFVELPRIDMFNQSINQLLLTNSTFFPLKIDTFRVQTRFQSNSTTINSLILGNFKVEWTFFTSHSNWSSFYFQSNRPSKLCRGESCIYLIFIGIFDGTQANNDEEYQFRKMMSKVEVILYCFLKKTSRRGANWNGNATSTVLFYF